MDLVLRYSNQTDRVPPLVDVLQRIEAGEDAPYGTVPPPAPDRRRPPAQTHGLTDDQVRTIFTYRQGTGPRELASRYDVTERAIKYLLKKHGLRRVRNGQAPLGSRP